jgi:stage II sporulation protein D
MSVHGTSRAATAVVFALAPILAPAASCHAPRSNTSERAAAARPARSQAAGASEELETEPSNTAKPVVAAAPRRRASGTVNVRLSSLEAPPRLELVDGDGTRLSATRAASKVRTASGEHAQLELKAAPGRPVEVGALRFPGAVRVQVGRDGQWEILNELDLEPYVACVVAKELGFGDLPTQAWRAQAIAARSYAVANLEQRSATRSDPYLFDGVRDQAYAGLPQPRNARERESLERMMAAVASTRGLILIEDGACVDARYNASCGGQTADGRAVFPELRSTCLASVECEPCAANVDARWSWTAPPEALEKLAQARGIGARVVRLDVLRRDSSGRWLEVELVGDVRSQRLRFEELRRELGRDKLRSARILDTWPKPGAELSGGMLFRGAGRGHGAGLCQLGALEFARRGWSAERILQHFYPGSGVEDRR